SADAGAVRALPSERSEEHHAISHGPGFACYRAKGANVTSGYAIFDTAIGCCGIAWSARGVAGVQLPEEREAATRARMRRRFPGAREEPPPPDVARALEGIVAHLRGEPSALDAVTLDMEDLPEFDRRVYEVARTIPPGATLSYGGIAARLGGPSESARD